MSTIANRIHASKISPLNEWTINHDEDENNEGDFEYDSMIKSFLAVQKMARADAKKAASKGDKILKSDYVDPLLFWKNNEKSFLWTYYS